MRENVWHVYVLMCKDGSYYTGLTRNVERRFKEHIEGRGARYTKLKRPVGMRYFETFLNRASAVSREIEIKKLEKKEKAHLIRFGSGHRCS